MAQYPHLSAAAQAVPLSIFARLYERLSRFQGDVIPLQIGDTHLPPCVRLPELDFAGTSELYAYAPPQGWKPLIEALVEKIRSRNQLPVTPENVQVTCGATHALSCAVGALLDPGDEIILLSPHWPLIKGIAQSRCVTPIEVPFTQPLIAGEDPEKVLEGVVTPRTSAIYLSTPNNPDGLVLDQRRPALGRGVGVEVAAAGEVDLGQEHRGRQVGVADLQRDHVALEAAEPLVQAREDREGHRLRGGR